jgi:hypothetical protein
MLLQLAMSMTRQVITVVVFIWPHTLFSLGPEARLRPPLVVLLNLEIFICFQAKVLGLGQSAFPLAEGVGDDGRVDFGEGCAEVF